MKRSQQTGCRPGRFDRAGPRSSHRSCLKFKDYCHINGLAADPFWPIVKNGPTQAGKDLQTLSTELGGTI